MAVEAPRIDLSPSQIISQRDFVKYNQLNANICSNQMDSSFVPFAETMAEPPLLLYQNQAFTCNPISARASTDKAESGLTHHMNSCAPKKRPRDSINDFDAFAPISQKNKLSSLSSSFLDQDMIFQLRQQQQQTDRCIAQHVEKMRLELEEQRKRQTRVVMSAIQEGLTKKLKEKDEEIQRMGKLNWVLQERLKSLYVENQIWRDLAQTNEATANTLRSNLEQVLANVGDERHARGAVAEEDDAESSCGSSDYGRCTVAAARGGNSMCRRCGERESSVLLLPCRHLCLCTVCGSSLIGSCPVCNSVTDASLHVNMS